MAHFFVGAKFEIANESKLKNGGSPGARCLLYLLSYKRDKGIRDDFVLFFAVAPVSSTFSVTCGCVILIR
jgi:hypothetical protein